MKKRFKGMLTTVLVIAIALALLATVFFRFRSGMNKEMNATVTDYLTENVDALATAFYTKLEDQLVMLESQTRYFQDVDLTDYAAMKETIMSTRGILAFTTIGVASSAGSTMNYLGKSSGNILLQDYFQEAMAGRNAISATTSLDEFGNEVLVLAVPIQRDESVVGVIYGTFTKDDLNKLLNTVHFEDIGTNVLITADGTILAQDAETDGIDVNINNLHDIIPGLNLSGIEDSFTFSYNDGEHADILVLKKVGFHDWYFGTILPGEIVEQKSSSISRRVLVVMVEATVVFIALLLYILLSARKHVNVKEELTEKAQTDLLTGILNKVSFQDAVQGAIRDAGDKECCALYIIDLDDFKHVNDNLGHAMGDKVLADTARKLRNIFRNSDVIGRIGGDEFAAFFRCPKERADELDNLMRSRAEAILRDVTETYEAGGKSVQVSVSVGVAMYPRDGGDYKTLYENADRALYTAKREGKNRYEAF